MEAALGHVARSGSHGRVFDSDAGSSLIETMVATALLLVVVGGLGSMGVVGMMTTENQGHLAARTTEYAQDKMEQLLVLAWGDETGDTRVFPAADTGGTGLKIGGNSNPATPVVGYVDYLNKSGTLVAGVGTAAPVDWYYKRVWAVSSPTANLKQIIVTVTVKSSLGQQRAVTSTVTALKTFPF
ncbi:MAG TPA: hypothetical protein VMZ90_08010 [Vicinamibacterales bacterium]|nr:hypothetical protein [Vicinamibacterales bacterium]